MIFLKRAFIPSEANSGYTGQAIPTLGPKLPHILRPGPTLSEPELHSIPKHSWISSFFLKFPFPPTPHTLFNLIQLLHAEQVLSYVPDGLKPFISSSIFGNISVYISLLVKKYIKKIPTFIMNIVQKVILKY